ncbi:MAG TPA: RraA family protein [archaeon]|nr:RraA family protein [archaeon]
MRNAIFCATALLILTGISSAQEAENEALRKGVNFIETKVYSIEENAALLKLYQGLRVVDVTDGLDMVGLVGTGLVDRAIHPSWRDLDSLSHHFCGIALTLRYVPTQRVDRPAPDEDFSRWEGEWYGKLSSEAFVSIIRPGDVIVIDDVEEKDIGSIGSNNILKWREKGAMAVVTDASARDVDEVAKEGVPLYLRHVGRGIRPGRNELESVNRPVSIGGVLVCPGDLVLGDGDGVVVVPRAVAEKVALYARRIVDSDKEGRKKLYERLGIPLDRTVK